MTKLMFMPLSMLGGMLAGLIGRRLFERVWTRIDGGQVPNPEDRQVIWPKLLLSLVIQGAIVRVARGLIDHGTRVTFSRLTGRWPGEERPTSAG
jgi:hypothetical protein